MKVQQLNQHLWVTPALLRNSLADPFIVAPYGGSETKTMLSHYSSIVSYNGHGGNFRPCTHTKISMAHSGSSTEVVHHAYDPYVWTAGTRSWAVASMVDAFHSVVVSRHPEHLIDDSEWNEHASDALEAMKPSLTSNNSLINFLIELKDFKFVGARLVNLFKNNKALEAAKDLAWGTQRWKTFSSRPWNLTKPRSKSQKLTDAWLEYKLAWAPFVSDVQKLVSGIKSFDKDVRQFLSAEGARQQRYWGKTLDTGFTSMPLFGGHFIPDTFSANNLKVDWEWTVEEVVETAPRFSATMRYHYALDDRMRAAAKTLDGFLDRLGINGDPSMLWNALPFTFVVDWFVNIGEYLNKMRVDNVRPVTEISDFCTSIKSERQFVAKMIGHVAPTYGSPAISGAVPVREVLWARSSSYKRRTGIPNHTLQLGNGLSGTRVITALSLLNSNIERR